MGVGLLLGEFLNNATVFALSLIFSVQCMLRCSTEITINCMYVLQVRNVQTGVVAYSGSSRVYTVCL